MYSLEEAAALLVAIDKGQQLAGHFPSSEALERSRKILLGELTPDEARAAILAEYAE